MSKQFAQQKYKIKETKTKEIQFIFLTKYLFFNELDIYNEKRKK